MTTINSYTTQSGVRYRVRYRKPDGSQTDKRGFKRKRDAEQWAAEHVTTAKAIDSYIDPQSGNAIIDDLYLQWEEARRPILKANTIATDDKTWRTHVQPKWGKRRINSITRAEVQEWVSGLASKRSPSTTIKAYAILKGVCDMAVKDRRIGRAPTDDVNTPRRDRVKPKRYLTVEQLLAFADEAGKAENVPDERRALVLLLGFCGLRWGEASGLRVRDIDFARNRIHIEVNITGATGSKTETTPKNHEVRDVPMPRIVADALASVIVGKGDDDRVFLDPSGNPLRFQSASDAKRNRTWWVSALRRAGLPLISPHDLRDTAASIAVSSGANVKALQRMLGHKSAAMTLDVYADLFDSDLDDVAVMIDARVDLARGKRGQNVGSDVGVGVVAG